MKNTSTAPDQFEPQAPNLMAAAICTVAALTLLWPLLTGHILFGGARSDMFIAGYSFRLFGAETFKETGSIPQWNPYLLGGLPYIAAMHGDIFYPTAWLRWIMPVDLAITWGMAIHFVLAGWFTFRFARALGLSWGASIFAGVAYELTGIVASQMSPGHDGKLFVSALAPLAFWTLLRAIRNQHKWLFGAFAIEVALIILGHYHMAYFLLIALGMWALYLAVWDSERAPGSSPLMSLGLAAVAVVVGLGITGLQVIPFFDYIKYSPRAEGGPNTGWEFATSYAFPPAEVFTTILPQFNGVLEHYWGQNPIKFHTEYIGFLPLALAALAYGDKSRRRNVIALTVLGVTFLFFSFGGYTPFYRPFFELLPMLKKIRAMGMVFFLPAFFIAMLAGFGLDRVLSRAVSMRAVLTVTGVFAVFALLGATGALQGVAEAMAIPQRADAVSANSSELQAGAIRLLLFVALGGAALFAVASGKLNRMVGVAAVSLIAIADLYSIDIKFYEFSPRANVLFADDAVTKYLRNVKAPYRVLDIADTYPKSILMAYRIPSVTGYHGFELRNYDEFLAAGTGSGLSPNFIDLAAVQYIILPQAQEIPGYKQVVPATQTPFGTTALLYARDSVAQYARVIPTAAKIAEDQVAPTAMNPQFAASSVALFPDTSSVKAGEIKQPFPVSNVKATVTSWTAGRMSIALAGADAAESHLLISENWYPDWHATVDGKPGVVRRADHTLLSVDVPAGAKQVELVFDSPAYAKGKMVSIVALLVAIAMCAIPMVMGRKPQAA